MDRWRRRLAAIAATVVVADQASKLISELAFEGQTTGPVIPVRNDELSLGIAEAATPLLVVVMALGIVVARLGAARGGGRSGGAVGGSDGARGGHEQPR